MKHKNKKKRHEHAWNTVTHGHLVRIAVYAVERQDLRSSRSRREAWDATNSGSRVDDEITKYVNMGRWALLELCVGFRLHYRLSHRSSIFWCFDTITIFIVIVIVIVIDGFLSLSYRNVVYFDIQHLGHLLCKIFLGSKMGPFNKREKNIILCDSKRSSFITQIFLNSSLTRPPW